MKRGIVITGILLAALTGCQKTGTPGQAEQAPASGTPAAQNAAPATAGAPSAGSASAPAPAAPATVEIPAGTRLEARIDDTLSTKTTREGDKFNATLEVPVVMGGREVLPRGARLHGHVTTSRPSGRMEGRAVLGITLDSIEQGGQAIPVATSLDTKVSDAHKKRNIEVIGGGAGLGAIIGAIAGGGKGAAIGAGAGAAAGAGGAAATGQMNVEIPAETPFTFRLKAPVQVKP